MTQDAAPLRLGSITRYATGTPAPGKVFVCGGIAAWLSDSQNGVTLILCNNAGVLARFDLDETRAAILCVWGTGQWPLLDDQFAFAGQIADFRDLVSAVLHALGGVHAVKLDLEIIGSLMVAIADGMPTHTRDFGPPM